MSVNMDDIKSEVRIILGKIDNKIQLEELLLNTYNYTWDEAVREFHKDMSEKECVIEVILSGIFGNQ